MRGGCGPTRARLKKILIWRANSSAKWPREDRPPDRIEFPSKPTLPASRCQRQGVERRWAGSHKRGSSFPRILWNSPPPGTGVDCVFGYSSSSSSISTSSGTLLIDYIRSYIEICTCSSDFGRFVFSYNLTKLNQGESLSSKRSCNFFISFFLLLLDHVIFYCGSSRWIF